MTQDRLEDPKSLVRVRGQSRQILQSQMPLAIDFRIGEPRREIAAAAGIRTENIRR